MRGGRLAAIALAGALAVPLVHAQTCEQFRDRLAARVDPGIKGFALEIVPGSAPVPAGAKVFGTCEGGARKILFFRNGLPAGGIDTAEASASAPAARPAAAAASVPPRPAVVPASAPAIARMPAASAPARIVAAAPAPPAPPASRAERAETVEPVPAVASEAASWPALQAATEPAAATVATAASQAVAPGPWRRLWPWLAGVAGLIGLGVFGVWFAHRRAYDAAGLPRGPRLRP